MRCARLVNRQYLTSKEATLPAKYIYDGHQVTTKAHMAIYSFWLSTKFLLILNATIEKTSVTTFDRRAAIAM